MENPQHLGAIFQELCATCGSPSKYRCPKCSVLSCSLQCVKNHKEENSCDGVRDKTTFVPVEEYREKDLQSDYHFLEEVNRKIDNAHRAKKNHGCLHYLPINLFRMQRSARLRGTNLRILPFVFAKRKKSTTYYRYHDKKIFWAIEWKFPQIDFVHFDERVDEEELLGKCLDKFLLPQSSADEEDKFSYYQSIGHKGIAVLMKDEYAPANVLRYHQLKQTKSLKENFKGKKIIEFPTFLVVPKIHLCAFPLFKKEKEES